MGNEKIKHRVFITDVINKTNKKLFFKINSEETDTIKPGETKIFNKKVKLEYFMPGLIRPSEDLFVRTIDTQTAKELLHIQIVEWVKDPQIRVKIASKDREHAYMS